MVVIISHHCRIPGRVTCFPVLPNLRYPPTMVQFESTALLQLCAQRESTHRSHVMDLAADSTWGREEVGGWEGQHTGHLCMSDHHRTKESDRMEQTAAFIYPA